MQFNKKLQEREHCLDKCARTQDQCETDTKHRTSCRDGFERCTAECEFDHS
jgi:hypothetical protein